MNLVETNSWEDFQQKLSAIQQKEKSQGRKAQFLYRGICDSTWHLKTTLARAGWEDVRISDYYELICGLKPQVESYTTHSWQIAEPPEMQILLNSFDAWALHKFPTPQIYSYMVYLRHHGFPSPLLDWTRSPFIAAFFAFRFSSTPKDGKVSIFVYSEMPEWLHVSGNSDPWVRRIGEHVRTHRRHFLQQSDYTMCAIFNAGPWRFANHENVFDLGSTNQDVLWKFNLPCTERTRVLALLDAYNLNARSLFESEESIMETLAFRTFDVRQSNG